MRNDERFSNFRTQIIREKCENQDEMKRAEDYIFAICRKYSETYRTPKELAKKTIKYVKDRNGFPLFSDRDLKWIINIAKKIKKTINNNEFCEHSCNTKKRYMVIEL